MVSDLSLENHLGTVGLGHSKPGGRLGILPALDIQSLVEVK